MSVLHTKACTGRADQHRTGQQGRRCHRRYRAVACEELPLSHPTVPATLRPQVLCPSHETGGADCARASVRALVRTRACVCYHSLSL